MDKKGGDILVVDNWPLIGAMHYKEDRQHLKWSIIAHHNLAENICACLATLH